MPELDAGLSANRSVALEMREERRLVSEGYELLDEKRVLLATEILRRLAAHRILKKEWLARYREARESLGAAIAAHGIEDLQLYPIAPRDFRIVTSARRVAGTVTTEPEAVELLPAAHAAAPAVWPSTEVETCAAVFVEVVTLGARAAIAEQNVRRLAREYVRTDRRARALENVLMPELDAMLRFIDEQLEYIDTEEAVRVHEAHRRTT